MLDHKAITLSQQIAVHAQAAPGCFASVCYPVKLGSLPSNGFGGSSLAIAINAAFQGTRKGFHLYSVTGYFIRPAKTDRKLFCQVETIRKSKSFETKEIRLTQEYENGDSKICLIALADFHLMDLKSMVAFSTPPELASLPLPISTREQSQKNLSQGSFPSSDLYHETEKFIEMKSLSPNTGRFNSRIHEKERLIGKLSTPSPQPIPIHAERFRARHPLHSEAEQISALAFYMDKGLAYIPALHNGYHPSQANACASLDFSLRFFEHDFNLEDWHYTEQKSVVASNARVYSEGRVWDSNGRILACMTQQTILRGASEIKARF